MPEGALTQKKSTYPVTEVAELMKLQEIPNMDKGIAML